MSGFYLGFIVRGKSKRPRASQGDPGACPRKFFEINMRGNLVHIETRLCRQTGNTLHVHWPRRIWWFFRYSYLYTVMITIFFGGGGGVGGASTSQISQIEPWTSAQPGPVWRETVVYKVDSVQSSQRAGLAIRRRTLTSSWICSR